MSTSYINKDGEVEYYDKCLDCEFSYVDNLFYELICKKDKCPFDSKEEE